MKEVIIIGGGPAGMIAAIQLARYGITPLLFEKNQLGGLLWNANLVENYPGFPSGITGPKLVKLLTKHYQQMGIKTLYQTVKLINYNDSFLVQTDENEYTSRMLVIASGTTQKNFPNGFIPVEARHRVFHEVFPLLDVRDKKIAIIGAGDAAFDYALNLAPDNKVTILNRSETIKALPLLVTRSKANRNISYLDSHQILSVDYLDENLHISTSGGDGHEIFVVDYLIGAIGRKENKIPLTESMKSIENSLVEMNKLYYIGDVKNGIYRQTAIAIGDGLKAAMQIYRFLKEN